MEHQRSEISGKERKKGSVGGQEGKKLEGKKTNEAIFGRKENKNMEVEYAEKKNRRIEERRKEKGEKCEVV